MSNHRKLSLIAALAWAVALPAAAQVEYRYPGTGDAARPAAQQPLPQQTVQQQSPPPANLPVCPECGTVESVRSVEQAAEGSGLGMIAGGLLGPQAGQGRGNTAATIVGAAGGAYGGHQVEKNVKKGTRYDVKLRRQCTHERWHDAHRQLRDRAGFQGGRPRAHGRRKINPQLNRGCRAAALAAYPMGVYNGPVVTDPSCPPLPLRRSSKPPPAFLRKALN